MTKPAPQIFHMRLSEIAQCATFDEWHRRFGTRSAVSAAAVHVAGDQAHQKRVDELTAEKERLLCEQRRLTQRLQDRGLTDPSTPPATLRSAAPHAAGDDGRRRDSPTGFAARLSLPRHAPGIRFAGGLKVFSGPRK